MPARPRRVVVIAGLPRSGTTLLATFLASQPHTTFVTDYVASFTDALTRLGVGWTSSLDPTQRRVALSIVRDNLLRFRHPVLVRADAFATMRALHEAVMDELAKPDDVAVGHKLVLDAPEVAAMVHDTAAIVIVLYRDPRDAAVSYFHTTGVGVEHYLERWRRVVTMLRVTKHPRLFAIRYESLVTRPDVALAPLFRALGLPLDVAHAELKFRRGPGGDVPWRGNATFGDPRPAFDAGAVERWRTMTSSPIVRYAAWTCRRELADLGYPPGPDIPRLEAARWARQRATHVALGASERWWERQRTRLVSVLAPPLRHP